MRCFANLHSTVTKNEYSNQRKLKHLETAHNDLISKVVKSPETTESRIESLETKLEDARISKKFARLEDELDRRAARQRYLNEENTRKLNALEIEQGFTNRNVYDSSSEVKERKMIISGVTETPGENVKLTALNCINKVVEAATPNQDPGSTTWGLRKLKIREIDDVFRIGKSHKGNLRRNISVTFQSFDDKVMIFRLKQT